MGGTIKSILMKCLQTFLTVYIHNRDHYLSNIIAVVSSVSDVIFIIAKCTKQHALIVVAMERKASKEVASNVNSCHIV